MAAVSLTETHRRARVLFSTAPQRKKLQRWQSTRREISMLRPEARSAAAARLRASRFLLLTRRPHLWRRHSRSLGLQFRALRQFPIRNRRSARFHQADLSEARKSTALPPTALPAVSGHPAMIWYMRWPSINAGGYWSAQGIAATFSRSLEKITTSTCSRPEPPK